MAQETKKPTEEDSIDENLRRVYQDALEEDIPDRFLTLLEQLRTQEKNQAGHEGTEES